MGTSEIVADARKFLIINCSVVLCTQILDAIFSCEGDRDCLCCVGRIAPGTSHPLPTFFPLEHHLFPLSPLVVIPRFFAYCIDLIAHENSPQFVSFVFGVSVRDGVSACSRHDRVSALCLPANRQEDRLCWEEL